jgi:hypothetical protein
MTLSNDEPKIPDFSRWATKRLQFMHQEYKESLDSIKLLHGKNHPEYLLYQRWVDAIKEELDKRDASRL